MLSVHASQPSPFALLALGLAVGIVSGMFGVGGGFMLTPLLNLLLGVPYPVAVGSGLCQMIGAAASAFLRHRELGQGEPRVDWLMLGGSLMGVHAGADTLRFLSRIPRWRVHGHLVLPVKLVLQPAYVFVLLATAVLMLAESLRRRTRALEEAERAAGGPLARIRVPPYVALSRVGLPRVSVPLLAYLGFGMGFLSGLLGIGGGVALMPVLLYGLGFPIRQAAGTGILVLLFTVMVGTVEHSLAGHVHLTIAFLLLVGSSLGAQFGALATHWLSAPVLRACFALVILGTAAALLIDLARSVLG